MAARENGLGMASRSQLLMRQALSKPPPTATSGICKREAR
jgi:hypothetical protein